MSRGIRREVKRPVRTSLLSLAAVILVFLVSVVSFAEERILTFQSLVTVNKDSTLVVRETIKVICENDKIKHGIYRDFPTSYDLVINPWLPVLKRNVGFRVVGTTRDGKSEQRHTEPLSNGVRTYLGSKDVIIPPGEHTYTITYETDRQLGFFKDHDELYWNVTGNGWEFPIDMAEATVKFPVNLPKDKIRVEGYTGLSGSKARNLNATFNAEGMPYFVTTKSLDSYEGLTIVAAFPKGFFPEPTKQMKVRDLIFDNPALFIVVCGLLLLPLYYFVVWLFVGKDPLRGVIMPLYAPPDDLSPAAVRYLSKMGFDDKVFVAAIINLAVKGHLKIQENKSNYTITKVNASPRDRQLSSEEDRLWNEMPDKVVLGKYEGSSVATMRSNLEETFIRRFSSYFKVNRGFITPGIAISIVTLVCAGIMENQDSWPVMIVSLFFVGTCWLTVAMYGIAWRMAKGKINLTVWVVVCIAIALVAGVNIMWYYLILLMKDLGFPILFLIVLFLTMATNLVFSNLLKARSSKGRKLMDQIEGFKMYLSAAEQGRIDRTNPPEKTPELFEKYLPYAMALDLEQRWAEQFAGVFAREGEASSKDSFSWFTGQSMRDFRSFSSTGFVTTFGSALSNAVSSSATAPGSSSGSSSFGGSGGSSGGGGGGGW